MTLPLLRTLPDRARRARRTTALMAIALSIAATASPVTQLATALPARAADIDLGIQAGIGLPCVEVDSWGAGTVTITQKRSGKVIKKANAVQGTMLVGCVTPLKSGDVLVVARGTTKRTVKVPNASLIANLTTNVISGIVPAAATQVKLAVQDFTAGFSTGLTVTPPVTPVAGAFTSDVSASLDLGRGDRAILSWSDGSDGWRIIRQSWTAIVEPDVEFATGTGKPGAKVTVTLKTAKGVVRGVATTTVKTQPSASAGFFDAAFRKKGKSILVKAGDVITATGVSGSFKVPSSRPVVSAAGNRVDATCPANSDWLVLRDLTKVAGGRTVNGSISVSPVNPHGSLSLGTRVLVACQTPKGFGVIREVVAE
jgi:hypothetical protein